MGRVALIFCTGFAPTLEEARRWRLMCAATLGAAARAAAGVTENEWPYAATPRTIWSSGMPAACHAAAALAALPCWSAGGAQASLSGALGPTEGDRETRGRVGLSSGSASPSVGSWIGRD